MISEARKLSRHNLQLRLRVIIFYITNKLIRESSEPTSEGPGVVFVSMFVSLIVIRSRLFSF